MRIFRDAASLDSAFQQSVLAIGNFDGVHKGHRALLDETIGLAQRHKVASMVMTFHPHPKRFFHADNTAMSLEPRHVKWRRLRALTLEAVLSMPFNQALASMEAEEFITRILVEQLRVTHIVVGENFCFGRGRKGTIALLQEFATRYSYGFTYVPPALHDNAPISSSRIRRAIAQGNMEEATAMLGRPYQLFGRVIHGDKRGRTLGVRTANIALNPSLHPPAYGVYAVRYAIMDQANCAVSPPIWKEGVANVGVRPTFGENVPLCEVHALNKEGELYGKIMRVRLIKHLRGERRFESEDALKAQIQRDITDAKAALEAMPCD